MAFYAVDLRDGVIQRVTQECHKVDNKHFFLIEAGFRETGMDKGQLCTGNEWQRRLWLLPPPSL